MARNVVADYGTKTTEDVATFARLGGRCETNTERDLHQWTRNLHDSRIEPLPIQMLSELTNKEGTREETVFVLRPSGIVDALLRCGSEEQILISLFGVEGRHGPSSFWRHAKQYVPWLASHPGIIGQNDERLAKTFLILLHLDGVQTGVG